MTDQRGDPTVRRHPISHHRPGRRPVLGAAAAVAMTVFLLGNLDADAVGQPGDAQDPTPDLPDLVDGPLPVDAAMVDIPTTVGIVQRNADIGFDQLGEVLDDPAAWVDRDGRIFIVEPATHPALREDGLGEADEPADPPMAEGTAESPGNDDPVLAGSYPPSMAFELESRPGAARVIHLDFDGATISGTAWNASYSGGAPFYADPYDTDGSPGTFSDAERAVIESVWRRVAEDFAAFDVNVTTKDPGLDAIERTGSGDQQYGTKVLISNTTTIYSSCGCGGVAYVGVFDATSWHSYYQPAWVFQRGVGSGAKGLAEAASHEAGHNLGLLHDGTSATGYYTGHGTWAPIMGVGYYRPVTQWSRGEYTDANNGEDDFAVMQANGLPILADDHGDTPASASTLDPASVDTTGIISTAADTDVFALTTTGGTVSLSASPAAVSPNIDIALELRDEAGVVVASADPGSAWTSSDVATGLDASISVSLAAGTYYLAVDGTGAGDPSGTGYPDYGSVGRYRVTGTIPDDGSAPPPDPPVAPTAVIDVSATSGTAPLAVTLDGSSSADADGAIVTYAWDLGDGSSADGPVVSHTYTSPGVFTATLTVTDDEGLTATASATIDVEPAPDPTVDVAAVSLDGTTARTGATPRATVRVVDDDGAAAGGVAVTGVFTLTALDGSVRDLGTVTGTTGVAGTLTLPGPTVADTLPDEEFSFCVLTLEPPAGMSHDPDLSSAPTCATWAHDRVPVFCRGWLATIVGAGTIRGTSGPDVIVGSAGRDDIRGLGGNDVICGGRGNDRLYGHGGNDRLFGEGGRDRLVGGPGRDRLVGGRGRDSLVRDFADLLIRSRGDRIVDHRRGR